MFVESLKETKVIFLDIDGVINITKEDNGVDEYGQIFNKKFVSNLRYIIEHTGAKIVISSTWRSSGLQIMKEMWIKRGLPGEVIGITPDEIDVVESGEYGCEYYDLVKRGHEIQYYIDSHNIKNYVILDDVPDFLDNQLRRFVHTYKGLDDLSAEMAVDILS